MCSGTIKVSIITVVFNGAQHLQQTIESVLNQSYKNIEYIIIDGGSNDGTIDIIKQYSHRISTWISEPDRGIYDAMNKGIDMATGELIGIINSDDWYEPCAVECVVNNYQEDTILYGLMRNIYNEVPIDIYAPFPNMIYKKMIPHSTCFVPAAIYNSYGKFDLKYKSCADYQFFIRLKQVGIKFQLLETVLANFRFGGFSWKVSSVVESFNMRYEMGCISRLERDVKVVGLFLKSLLNGKI